MIRNILLGLLVALVLREVRRRIESRRGRPESGGGGVWDPYAVLDVPRGAPRDAITRAYHEQMKRYHPDRVADLGVELQQLAHQKTLELRRAYDELTR